MQWKVPSSLAAITSLLLSAGDLVVAQITAPDCTAAGLSWVRLCRLFYSSCWLVYDPPTGVQLS
jgi:hypothetical protein